MKQNNLQQEQAKYRQELLKSLSGSGTLLRIRRGLLRLSWTTLDYSHVLLLLGIAGYKFLEWTYSEEGSSKLRQAGIDAPIPPPPLPPQFLSSAIAIPTDPRLCPICRKERSNPAMSISGYVFCYPCLYRYVEEKSECPISRMRCNTQNITKIYDEDVTRT